jgi:N-acetyl-gamma-glutamyl-phosphate reductase
MKKVRVGILGATGYSGAEAVRLLLQHPGVEIAAVTAEQHAGQRLAAVHPFLRACDLTLEEAIPAKLAHRIDVAISALPEAPSADVLPALATSGVRVIDISAAFRIKSDELHLRWYKADPAPALRRAAVYGLTEWYREAVRGARFVANPGCYPTGVLLPLLPLLQRTLIAGPVMIDAKSGVSGARRKAAIEQLFCEVNESARAYAVGDHRHGPEMEQEIERLVGAAHPILFAPHILPISRGILTTIYAPVAAGVSTDDVGAALEAAYRNEPFVLLCRGRWPEVREIRGTNSCAIGWTVHADTRTAVLVSVLDNLGKGAAGQAIQNLNLMCGFAETEGLCAPPWGP